MIIAVFHHIKSYIIWRLIVVFLFRFLWWLIVVFACLSYQSCVVSELPTASALLKLLTTYRRPQCKKALNLSVRPVRFRYLFHPITLRPSVGNSKRSAEISGHYPDYCGQWF